MAAPLYPKLLGLMGRDRQNGSVSKRNSVFPSWNENRFWPLDDVSHFRFSEKEMEEKKAKEKEEEEEEEEEVEKE